MALDLDPTHLPTLAALRQIAIDAADWDRAARYLDQEQLNTQAPRQRARLLVELGRLRDETLGEHDAAVQAYELALQSDADNEEAALPLLTEYINKEKWTEAEPLADLLVKKGGKKERREQHTMYNMLGRVATALGKEDDKALRAYQDAHKLDLTDGETIQGPGRRLLPLEGLGRLAHELPKGVTSLDEGDTDERANVYYKLGAIKKEQGQNKPAIRELRKVARRQGVVPPALEALIGVYTRPQGLQAGLRLQAPDPRRQSTRAPSASSSWSRSATSGPSGRRTRTRHRDLRRGARDRDEEPCALAQASSALPGHFELAEDDRVAPDHRGPRDESLSASRSNIYTMAQIYRDKEEDLDRAVEAFNETLDLNPFFLEAFERINKILTQKKDWKQLERAFRKMLHRVAGKGNTDLEYNLWHNLGLIYRDRLGDLSPGIEAFKMAGRLKPDEVQERQILAELYESTDQIDLAIQEQQEILGRDALRVEPYRALYRLYVRQQAIRSGLVHVPSARVPRQSRRRRAQVLRGLRAKGMLQVKSRLDNDLWAKQLFHPDENIYIGKIFEFLVSAARQAKIQQLKNAKQYPTIDKKFKQDPATSTVTFAKTFGWAAQVLGVHCPELYVLNHTTGALGALVTDPPSSFAGQSVLTGFSPQELTFIVGKHLAYYRGEHY